MNALFVLLVLLPPQEDAAELVRRLSDELLEVRAEAERKLIALGEPARSALVKLQETGDAELKARIQNILRTLDIQKELRAWFAPPTRISLSGEATLEQAVREVERQSGQRVRCDSWPEGPFKIDLKEVPYWEALEKLCEASGARSLSVTPSGPELVGAKYIRTPSSVHGAFNIRFDSIVEYRRFPLATRTESRSLSLLMSLGWERSITPTQICLALSEVRDDTGKDYLGAVRQYEAGSFSGGSWYVKEPPPTYMSPLQAGAFAGFPEKASQLAVKGSVLLWIRAAPGNLELRMAVGGAPSEARVQILDRQLREAAHANFALSGLTRQGPSASFALAVSNLDVRMLRNTYNLWHLKDKAGRTYVANVRQIQRENDRGVRYTLSVDSLPADSEFDSFVIRIPPRVLALEIPFELKSIPLK